jgi:hypothetical protein
MCRQLRSLLARPMRAPLSRTAAISARWTEMFLSRVMISQDFAAVLGIHSVSGV